MKVADAVWVATALLHNENPTKPDFSVDEIVDRAVGEHLAGGYRPGLPIHASLHCIASKRPNPANHRMLTETGRGRRRLYRHGDNVHPHRTKGKVRPEEDQIPPKYSYLIAWYDNSYVYSRGDDEDSGSDGGALSALLRFAGAIPAEDLSRMQAAIKEGCEEIDRGQW